MKTRVMFHENVLLPRLRQRLGHGQWNSEPALQASLATMVGNGTISMTDFMFSIVRQLSLKWGMGILQDL
jgi:hypothetical protein